MFFVALIAMLIGAIFAGGLIIADLHDPNQILAFLDVTGDWNFGPLIVLCTAAAVYALGYKKLVKRPKPIVAKEWNLPSNKKIEARLVIGGALFGAGWGLTGYCPGPAILGLAFSKAEIFVFVLAMLCGGGLFQLLHETPKR